MGNFRNKKQKPRSPNWSALHNYLFNFQRLEVSKAFSTAFDFRPSHDSLYSATFRADGKPLNYKHSYYNKNCLIITLTKHHFDADVINFLLSL